MAKSVFFCSYLLFLDFKYIILTKTIPFYTPVEYSTIMNFQGLAKIEEYQFFLDVAFKYAKDRAAELKDKVYNKTKNSIQRKKRIEQIKVKCVEKSLQNRLSIILSSYPNIDDLPEFYNELVKTTIDYPQLKKSLGALNWASQKIHDFTTIYERRVMTSPNIELVSKNRASYYGRISSVMRQIKKNLVFLDESRKTMRGFPTVKTSLFTVSLFGFPNIGKTTLLYKLTGSKPEINSYAFTTKNLNISYFKLDNKRIQVIDTPGSLNRFDKMNTMEKQAHLSLKHCTDIVVYIFDLTEPYPLDQQKKLLQLLKKEKKDIIVYMTKKDIIDKETFAAFKKTNYIDSPEELKETIAAKYHDKKE